MTSTKKITKDRIKPAVRWPGGKSRLLKELLPLIPPHTCYVEPFAGGLAMLLAKAPSPIEVINDINHDLVGFYRCVRFHRDELLTELEFVLNSREEFNDFRQQPGLTDIQRAARWFFRNKTCFGGANLDVFGTSATTAMSSRAARMEAIRALNYRLDKTTIEHRDWQQVMKLYDRSETFFFIDPPYTGCKIPMYDEWEINDVRRMRDFLFTLKGKWLLTFNDIPEIRRIFDGCEIKGVARHRGVNNKQGAKIYRELIIRPGGRL
ncbi:MAG: DNA adenine methylase [Verrucomicrobiales bacterium]|jgi:DNA adenine methylase|nr:DNA adenine methylase [Verrucomicrobiales bacterium]